MFHLGKGFYRNYSSKEDVLDEIAQITYEELASFITDKKYESNPYPWYLDLFHIVSSNAESFQLLTQVKVPHDYLFRIETPLKELLAGRSHREYYRYIAVVSSIKENVMEWFKKGMKESSEEMAAFFIELYHS